MVSNKKVWLSDSCSNWKWRLRFPWDLTWVCCLLHHVYFAFSCFFCPPLLIQLVSLLMCICHMIRKQQWKQRGGSPKTDMDIDRTRIWGIHWIPIFRHWYDILESILEAPIFSAVNIVTQMIRWIDLSQATYRFNDMAIFVTFYKSLDINTCEACLT